MAGNIDQAVNDFRAFLEDERNMFRHERGFGIICTYEELAEFVKTGWGRDVTTPENAPKADFCWYSGEEAKADPAPAA